jgi:ABC-type transport system substrate-binding protein
MNYAIDKQKMVRLLHGMVIPARGVLPPMMPGYNSNLVEYPFDPAKARQLLAESGHPNGFSCKLWFAGGGLTGPITSSLQYDLAQVGINAQLNPVSYAPLVDSVGRRKTVQTSIGGWVQDYPDPSDFLDTLFNGAKITAENCQNNAFYNNPKVNQLLADAAACKDAGKRLRIYQAVEESVMADAPIVPLDHPYAFSLRKPWLHGVQLHPVLTFRFERMWIER